MRKKLIASIMGLTLFAITLLAQTTSKTYDGVTFVFSGKTAYLFDMDKSVINTWNCPNSIQGCADLLRDSSIIVPAKTTSSSSRGGGSDVFSAIPLSFTRLQILDWEGEVTWDFRFSGTDFIAHHDIEPVYRTNDPDEEPTFLVVCATSWGDKIVEIRRTGDTTGEIIWEWKASDHRCQSGCTDEIGMLDGTYGGIRSMNQTSDIMHTNNISFNRILNQLVLSVKGFNEMIVIDHSTTTAEAAGTSGGAYGKGGQILYRWGSPKNYGASGSTQLSGQHHCCWVPDIILGPGDTIPGSGNFMIIDNGNGRAIEITCPGTKNGVYPRTTGEAFAPSTHLWQYKPSGLASNEGSIQKMPNGNYVIGTGGTGGSGGLGGISKVYEVNASGSVVWELDLDDIGNSTEAYRYAYEYLNGKTNPVQKRTPVPFLADRNENISVRYYGGRLTITAGSVSEDTRCSLFAIDGREVVRSIRPSTDGIWNFCGLPAGTYISKIVSNGKAIMHTITMQQ